MSYISEIFRIVVFNLKISIINQLAIYLWVVSGFVAYVYFTNLLAKYRMKMESAIDNEGIVGIQINESDDFELSQIILFLS